MVNGRDDSDDRVRIQCARQRGPRRVEAATAQENDQALSVYVRRARMTRRADGRQDEQEAEDGEESREAERGCRGYGRGFCPSPGERSGWAEELWTEPLRLLLEC